MCGGSAWELEPWRLFTGAHGLAADMASVRESRALTTAKLADPLADALH